MTRALKTIVFARDTASRWARINRTLAEGEPGLEIDSGRFKIGDGLSRWLELDYFTPNDGDPGQPPTDEQLLDHINSTHPHPVYDDGPSLELLYQNAKV